MFRQAADRFPHPGFLVLMLALVAPAVTRADVLFLDVNNAPLEIAAARRAAEARGEKLIVLPRFSEADRKRIVDLNAARSPACMRATPVARDCVLRAQQSTASLDEFLADKKLTSKSLKAELKALEAGKASITSIVISGHDGMGNFSGEFGDTNDRQIAEALESAPSIAQGVRSLHLWGCYTAVPGTLDFQWKKVFPNLVMVSGFNGSAPSKGIRTSHDYLENVLKAEKKLIDETDSRKLERLFKALPGVSQMAASACVNDKFVSPKGVQDMKAVIQACASAALSPAEMKMYECYLRAETPECQNPPANTQTNPLRQMYNRLQNTQHCMEDASVVDLLGERPPLEIVIRLILFGNVKENYARLHQDDLRKLDEVLRKSGAPESLAFSGLEKMSRGELLKKFEDFQAFLNSQGLESNTKLLDWDRFEQRKQLELSFSHLTQRLRDLEPQCVPFSWVEPGASEVPFCSSSSMIGETAEKEASRLRKRAEASVSLDQARMDDYALFRSISSAAPAGNPYEAALRTLEYAASNARLRAREAGISRAYNDDKLTHLRDRLDRMEANALERDLEFSRSEEEFQSRESALAMRFREKAEKLTQPGTAEIERLMAEYQAAQLEEVQKPKQLRSANSEVKSLGAEEHELSKKYIQTTAHAADLSIEVQRRKIQSLVVREKLEAAAPAERPALEAEITKLQDQAQALTRLAAQVRQLGNTYHAALYMEPAVVERMRIGGLGSVGMLPMGAQEQEAYRRSLAQALSEQERQVAEESRKLGI